MKALVNGRARLAVVVLALGVTLAACGTSGPSKADVATRHSKIPVADTSSCAKKPPPATGTFNVPVTVSTVATGKLVTVGVCIGTNGPYPFVVDTGSSRSIIDSSLVTALRLKGAGPVDIGGSGCATTGTLVKVPSFRMGNVELATQGMVTSSLSNWGGASVDGVLGSDVFGRFGAVKIDFPSRTLSVVGVEGAAPTSRQLIQGRSGSAPPAALLAGTPTADLPLTVVEGPGTIAAFVNVTVSGTGPFAFSVDTGAPTSTMDQTAAYTAKIPNKGTGPAPAGIGCTGTLKLLDPAVIVAGSVSATLPMASMHIEGTQRLGIVGYLGLDYLGTSGSIVVDYSSANIAFASG